MRSRCLLGWGLLVLAVALAANSLAGPLVLGVIDYRYGSSMTNQGIGLDAVVLAFVVPACVLAGVLTLRGHRAGAPLALGPTAFAAYMLPQYLIGPEYGRLPGNNERFVVLHLAAFALAGSLLLLAFLVTTAASGLPRDPRRREVRRAWVLAGVATFLLLRWAPALTALARGDRSDAAYRDNPTAFLLVALLDLALVVPTAAAAAVGMWRSARWAGAAGYLVVGWFSFVPVSVASMALVMQVRDDPQASAGGTAFLALVAALSLAAATAFYRPLLKQSG